MRMNHMYAPRYLPGILPLVWIEPYLIGRLQRRVEVLVG